MNKNKLYLILLEFHIMFGFGNIWFSQILGESMSELENLSSVPMSMSICKHLHCYPGYY